MFQPSISMGYVRFQGCKIRRIVALRELCSINFLKNLTAGTGSYTRGVWLQGDFFGISSMVGEGRWWYYPVMWGIYSAMRKVPIDQPMNTAEMSTFSHVLMKLQLILTCWKWCAFWKGGSGNATHFHNTPLEEAGVVGPIVYLYEKKCKVAYLSPKNMFGNKAATDGTYRWI